MNNEKIKCNHARTYVLEELKWNVFVYKLFRLKQMQKRTLQRKMFLYAAPIKLLQ